MHLELKSHVVTYRRVLHERNAKEAFKQTSESERKAVFEAKCRRNLQSAFPGKPRWGNPGKTHLFLCHHWEWIDFNPLRRQKKLFLLQNTRRDL